jgi:hypothetical protein
MTYSQSLTCYTFNQPGEGGGEPWHFLPALYQLASHAPGCSLSFTGVDAFARPLTITIPSDPANTNMYDSPYWNGYLSNPSLFPHVNSKAARDERDKANRLLFKNNVVTITCDNAEVYADASYIIERAKFRTRMSGGLCLGGQGTQYPVG